jgi:hypothetical protein
MAEANCTKPLAKNAKNLKDVRFGRLLVVEFSGDRSNNNSPIWICQCDCGNIHRASAQDLGRKTGLRSCGCLAREATHNRTFKHGLGDSLIYKIWNRIISRCHNERDRAFNRYGGRGISVCQRWRDSVEAFVADMGPRPSTHHSVERKNNNGNYEPSNCKWGTDIEQGRNRRNNRLITINDETLCLSAWIERLGVNRDTFYWRVNQGWSEQEALTVAGRRRNIITR